MEEDVSAIEHARTAVQVAEGARSTAEAVSLRVGDVLHAVERLRAENTTQHVENQRVLREEIEKVHSRISSVRSMQDDRATKIDQEFAALRQVVAAKELENVKSEAVLKEEQHKLIIRCLLGAVVLLACAAAALLKWRTGVDIQVPSLP